LDVVLRALIFIGDVGAAGGLINAISTMSEKGPFPIILDALILILYVLPVIKAVSTDY
jgi:hypothetical protein